MDDYESDTIEDDFYDSDDDADNEPFFGSLLKSQSEIAKENAKEKEEKLLKKSTEEQKLEEKTSEAKRYHTRPRLRKVVPSSDEEDFVEALQDDSSDEEPDIRVKKDCKCLLCSDENPKTKYFRLKGPKCRKNDIEGKLQKLLGTIPVFCLPGNPYICDPCFKKTIEWFAMWETSSAGIKNYMEKEEPRNVAKSVIKLLEHKLQFVVKKFLHEKLSDVGEDVTIMGNVYVSIGNESMVMFPIDSTAEIQTVENNDDVDDDNNDDDDYYNAPMPAPEEEKEQEDKTEDLGFGDTSFRSEDLGGILDANMGGSLDNIDFNDIEVDVEYFGTSAVDRAFTVDFEEMAVKKDQLAKDDIELGVTSHVKTTGPSTKNKPSLAVNISYSDIQKAEEALIKGNPAKGRCPVCKILFYPHEYLRHTDTSDRKKCLHCPFQTSLTCVFKKHVKKNHKDVTTTNTTTYKPVNNTAAKALFKCDQCSRCFNTHFLMNKHRIFFHGAMKVYPEYVKGKLVDEVSAGSSSEEEVAEDDPDYSPTYWDYDPEEQKKHKAKQLKQLKKIPVKIPTVKKPSVKNPSVKRVPKEKAGPFRVYVAPKGCGPRGKRSVVWHYYELTNNILMERQTARCLMCGREVTRKDSSTWAMINHLTTKHSEIDLSRPPPGSGYPEIDNTNDETQRAVRDLESMVNGDSRRRKGDSDDESVSSFKRPRKTYGQHREVTSSVEENQSNTQYVMGSEGNIQVATPEVIKSLREKGIEITKYNDGSPQKGDGGGRVSPTSAAVASIAEDDDAMSALMGESVSAGGVNVPLSELLDDATFVTSSNNDSEGVSGLKDVRYVTQKVKEKSTGEILLLRIPQSPAKVKTLQSSANNGAT